MSWVSDFPVASLCSSSGRRTHASSDGAGARPRPPDAASAIPHVRVGVTLLADRACCPLEPALTPLPARREASSGVISFRPSLEESASKLVRRNARGEK
jgi:hypothetical protein